MSARPTLGAALVAGLAVFPAASARAGPFTLKGGHASYGVGVGLGAGSLQRHDLDLGVAFGTYVDVGSREGMWGHGEGWLLAAGLTTGFGVYPTYVDAGFGYGWHATLGGVGAHGGPTLRVHPGLGAGVAVRVAADLWLLQLGLRLIGIAYPWAELQLTATLGLGRF